MVTASIRIRLLTRERVSPLTIGFNNGHIRLLVLEDYFCWLICLEDNKEGFVFLHHSVSSVWEDIEWDTPDPG